MKTNLSKRMQAIADMVLPNEAAADIGTDHGKIPYYLLSENICPFVILSDINEGPFNIAKNNFSGCFKINSDFRLGNGLEVIENNEVSTVIIAGMGGELIEEIISKDLDKSKSFKKIILQPRSKSDELRVFLSEKGFEIIDYDLALERGRICEIFAIRPGISKENIILSEYLIKHRPELFDAFIKTKIIFNERLISSLIKSKQPDMAMITRLKDNNIYFNSLI